MRTELMVEPGGQTARSGRPARPRPAEVGSASSDAAVPAPAVPRGRAVRGRPPRRRVRGGAGAAVGGRGGCPGTRRWCARCRSRRAPWPSCWTAPSPSTWTVASDKETELLREDDGRIAGRLVRVRWPLAGRVTLAPGRSRSAAGPCTRSRSRSRTSSRWDPPPSGAGPSSRGEVRDLAARSSFAGRTCWPASAAAASSRRSTRRSGPSPRCGRCATTAAGRCWPAGGRHRRPGAGLADHLVGPPDRGRGERRRLLRRDRDRRDAHAAGHDPDRRGEGPGPGHRPAGRGDHRALRHLAGGVDGAAARDGAGRSGWWRRRCVRRPGGRAGARRGPRDRRRRCARRGGGERQYRHRHRRASQDGRRPGGRPAGARRGRRGPRDRRRRCARRRVQLRHRRALVGPGRRRLRLPRQRHGRHRRRRGRQGAARPPAPDPARRRARTCSWPTGSRPSPPSCTTSTARSTSR